MPLLVRAARGKVRCSIYCWVLPYRGSLKVNGIELRELEPQVWRSQLSWVGQNPHLPEQTLAANILLRQPDASEHQLQHAVERAYINEFLKDLPQGLNTEIGDHSARLSVGQAQRIAVARALLNPCRLLLLDEPTASLDAHSEQLVMKALEEASRCAVYPAGHSSVGGHPGL